MYFVVFQILMAYFDAGVQVGQDIPHIANFAYLDACSLVSSCQPFALLGPAEAHNVLPLVRLSQIVVNPEVEHRCIERQKRK